MNEKQKFIGDLIMAHQNFNKLLVRAYRHDLKIRITVNELMCVKNDERSVIGMTIESIETKMVYKDEGIP